MVAMAVDPALLAVCSARPCAFVVRWGRSDTDAVGAAAWQTLVRADEGTLLPTTIKEHFRTLSTMKGHELIPAVKSGSVPEGISKHQKALLQVFMQESEDSKQPSTSGSDVLVLEESVHGKNQCAAMKRSQSSANYMGSVISFDWERSLFTIQPAVTRRINNIHDVDDELTLEAMKVLEDA